MSPDDPTPPTPPARPPGVKRDRLPTPDGEVPIPTASSSQRSRRTLAGLILGIAVVVIIVFVAANSGSSPKPSPPPPESPTPAPSASSHETTSTEQETPPPPKPAAKGPEKVWQTEITLEQNASYNIDQLPITKEKPSGYEVTSEGSLEAVGAAKTAPWSSHEAPHFADCQRTLASTSGEAVKLERPGQWVCGETNESSGRTVARLRFDGANGHSYRFLVTVYKPGHS